MQPNTTLPGTKINQYIARLHLIDSTHTQAEELLNTYGTPLTWTNTSTGEITTTLEGKFPKNKTLIPQQLVGGTYMPIWIDNPTSHWYNIDNPTNDSIVIRSALNDGTPIDLVDIADYIWIQFQTIN